MVESLGEELFLEKFKEYYKLEKKMVVLNSILKK